MRHRCTANSKICRRVIAGLRPQIDCYFQPDRPWAAGFQCCEGGANFIRSVTGPVDAVACLCELPEDRELVGDFMQEAVSLSLCPGRDLAGQRQYRRVDRIGGRKGRGGIQEARAGYNTEGLRRSGSQRRPHGHVGGALLVTRLDWGQTIRTVEQGVEKPVILDAWKAIEVFDPVGDQPLHG